MQKVVTTLYEINWHQLTFLNFLEAKDIDKIREFLADGYILQWEPSY